MLLYGWLAAIQLYPDSHEQAIQICDLLYYFSRKYSIDCTLYTSFACSKQILILIELESLDRFLHELFI
jgi:hypothetical protein